MSETCKFKTCEYGFCVLYPTDYATNGDCPLNRKKKEAKP